MAFVQADIDELRRSMSTGASQMTTRDGQTIMLRSLAEMQRLLAQMEAEVAGIAGQGRTRPQVIAVAFGPPRGGHR